jgi:nucleoside-diphosphate-sugar epimerase
VTLLCVTGANGFIGKILCRSLAESRRSVRGVVRNLNYFALCSDTEFVAVGDIGPKTNWFSALNGIDCLIHCAARAHVIRETEADALAAYRVVNVEGTCRLAEQAAAAGVRRFVFLSSIGVNGRFTDGLPGPFEGGSPRSACDDELNSVEDYAISKWEAEQALWEISKQTGLEVVVVRPPLVYGPGVKGNFLRLLRLIDKGLPLPLGAVKNLRSFVGLDNLVDLLIRCVDHPAAPGQIFLVSDGQDISTPDLIRTLARMMNKPARLWPVPVPLLQAAGSLTGKRKEVDRLVGSLRVDSKHTQDILGWSPPVSLEADLQRMVDWYLAEHRW